MNSIQQAIRTIVKKMKNEDVQVRLQAIMAIQRLDLAIVNTSILRRVIKEAASSFPKSVAKWDDPCAQLLQFVCQYEDEALLPLLTRYYPRFSSAGQDLVMLYACRLGPKKAKSSMLYMLQMYIPTQQVRLPVSELMMQPSWLSELVPMCISYIDDPYYSFAFHQLLEAALEIGAFSIQQHEVRYQIYEKYKKLLYSIMEYNEAYSEVFVYHAWRASYLAVRTELCLYIRMMGHCTREEVEALLMETLNLKDPVIRTYGVCTLIHLGIAVEQECLFSCATNIESAYLLYTELHRKNKAYLYPIGNKMEHLVKSFLFYYLLEHEECGMVPSDIEVMSAMKQEQYTNVKVRYRFAHTDWLQKGWLIAEIILLKTEPIEVYTDFTCFAIEGETSTGAF
ncbi:hypothetical protein P6P90_04185 [Ectobacillus antri]|jgi:hypothetical protein|uniref:HEAT repeat domain-containing protein n=1 Tax=Ectobacillus antri TaxID=2486280 RepID=A0ABT6H338_9BACI|nr:hypothetical protein [Ectobacillus antri]MDG4655440.1 hypothetical protein [Ectobacillus antri]MDG5753198.1 hypothetical protein [Ectobacillus antri]